MGIYGSQRRRDNHMGIMKIEMNLNPQLSYTVYRKRYGII